MPTEDSDLDHNFNFRVGRAMKWPWNNFPEDLSTWEKCVEYYAALQRQLTEAEEQRDAMQRRAEAAESDMEKAEERERVLRSALEYYKNQLQGAVLDYDEHKTIPRLFCSTSLINDKGKIAKQALSTEHDANHCDECGEKLFLEGCGNPDCKLWCESTALTPMPTKHDEEG